MTKCYLCQSEITREPKHSGEGYKDSLGKTVVPTSDYRCVDFVLTNGRDMVGYATPVCRLCHAIVLRGDNWEDVKNNLLSQIKIHNFGPPHFFKKAKDFKVVSVKDLTMELQQNGII